MWLCEEANCVFLCHHLFIRVFRKLYPLLFCALFIYIHLFCIAHSTSSQNSHLPGQVTLWYYIPSSSFRLWNIASFYSLQFIQTLLTFQPVWLASSINISLFPHVFDNPSCINSTILIKNPHFLSFPIPDPTESQPLQEKATHSG